MIEQLSERIWSHDQFHAELSELQEKNLRNRYIGESEENSVSEEMLRRLLQCASTLSASKSSSYREAAYRIVTAASELVGHDLHGVPYVMLLALSRMGNFPALSYAMSRYSISEDSLPLKSVGESKYRREANSIKLGDELSTLTDFQLGLWNELNASDTLGISAPTSAGKSYVLQAFAQRQIVERVANNIVFVVPTRALINQVSEDVSKWVGQTLDDSGLELITTPVPQDVSLPKRAVFVLTQERLQLLQTSHPDLTFELMLVDEAQSISEGPRGVLLSSVIEQALDRNPKMQLLFAGPNLHEPGKLSGLFGRSPNTVSTNEAAVVQNIIYVDCDAERPKAADLSLRVEESKRPLGKIYCDQPLVDHRSKLVNVALRMGTGGQNLIYALGPAECEKIAFGLADTDSSNESEYLNELSSFIKEAVHPKYQLASNVLKNVGYHYGRLPSLVRKSIEEAFALGHLKFLVTTSTLLQGVNMPAQNLFLHEPQKGKGEPIPPTDFWNLAGRAGRLGKEFSGNIFLIDYSDWDNDPMSGDKDREVIPAIEQHVVHQIEDLISYIDDPEVIPDRNKPDEFENTFVKLVQDHFDGNLARTLDRLGLAEDNPKRNELLDSIATSVHDLSITSNVLSQSPTVSTHRQQSLYEWLDDSLNRKGPAYVIPKHPRDKGAYHSYLACIKRCHGAILKYPKSDKSHLYYAQMCRRWMMGQPLPMMIDASFDYKVRQKQNPNIATVIRTTLSEVENDLRFKYVRLFSCYNAVLEQVLRDHGMKDLLSSIPSIPMYLELGACSSTMISFMGLGLSRYTSGKLQELPRRGDMSQAEARTWLRRQDVSALDLPMASVREISRMGLSR